MSTSPMSCHLSNYQSRLQTKLENWKILELMHHGITVNQDSEMLKNICTSRNRLLFDIVSDGDVVS